MKKSILSLAALCLLTAFSSEKLISAGFNVYHPFNKKLNVTADLSPSSDIKIHSLSSLLTMAPLTYRNMKPDAGYLEVYDVTTGTTYPGVSLPSTGSTPANTGISVAIGDVLEVTVYSGNGNCSITCNGSTEAGVSSMYISQPFLPNPSWIVIQ